MHIRCWLVDMSLSISGSVNLAQYKYEKCFSVFLKVAENEIWIWESVLFVQPWAAYPKDITVFLPKPINQQCNLYMFFRFTCLIPDDFCKLWI